MNAVHFSSKTDMWATPQAFYDAVSEEFQFTLDACAVPENAKCQRFFSPEEDGLKQAWAGTVWCNPPYGRGIGEWVKKAYVERLNGVTTVMLLPARTDTQWFHYWILSIAEVRFLKGRLKFGGAKNAAPFPSMLVIFRPV